MLHAQGRRTWKLMGMVRAWRRSALDMSPPCSRAACCFSSCSVMNTMNLRSRHVWWLHR